MDIPKLGAASNRRGTAMAVAVLSLAAALGAGTSATLSAAEGDAATAALALRTASVRCALDTTFQRYADTMHDLVAATAGRPGRRSPPPSPAWSANSSPAHTRSSSSPSTTPS